MNSDFYLVKITDHADDLLNGKIYMQPLRCFREQGYQEPTSSLRGDCFDGLLGIYDYENLPYDSELRRVILACLDRTTGKTDSGIVEKSSKKLIEIPPSAYRVSATYGGIGSSDDLLKMFCMYMLPFNRESKTIAIPDKRICAFGNRAVVIKNWIEFIERVYVTVQSIGLLGKGVVRYPHDYYHHGSLGITEKRSDYKWQSEFRLWVDEFDASESPLILDIGDISDIAEIIDTRSLLDVKTFFEGEYSPTPSTCYERDAMFSTYYAQRKLLWLVRHNELAGSENHFRAAQNHFANDNMRLAIQEIDKYLSLSFSNPRYDNCVPYYFDLSLLYLHLAEDYANIGHELISRAFVNSCMTFYMRAVRKPHIDGYLSDCLKKIKELWHGNEELWNGDKCLNYDLGFSILVYEVLMKLL